MTDLATRARTLLDLHSAPDVLVLRKAAAGYQIGLARDVFPAEPNVAWTTVTFDPALFDDPAFTTRDVGPFVVIGRAG